VVRDRASTGLGLARDLDRRSGSREGRDGRPGPAAAPGLRSAGAAGQGPAVRGGPGLPGSLDQRAAAEFTDYGKTVLYTTYDVTDQLTAGRNVIGAELGRGFYGLTTENYWNWDRAPWHGEPRLLLQLVVEHSDGSPIQIVTDTTWRTADGPTRSDSLYAGETYDARLERSGWTMPDFDDSGWDRAVRVGTPGGTLRAQRHEPIRVVHDLVPVAYTQPAPGVWIADLGQTTAGWSRVRITELEGTMVSLTHGETLAPDGTVNAHNGLVPGRFQRDEYIAKGRGTEVWEPSFSYKGFRYVQIEGLSSPPSPGTLTARVAHTDVRRTAWFCCSDPLFEAYDRAMRRTVLNNLHGIPTDTPAYEKNGWTGDVHVAAPTMAIMFDLSRFLTKWLGDLRDSQIDSGQIPVVVPSGGYGYEGPGNWAPAPEWTTVYPVLVAEMNRWYGDRRLGIEHGAHVRRYLDWELARLRDGLAHTALGDWLAPGTGGTPPEDTRLTATAYLHRALLHAARYLEPADAVRYVAAARRLARALNAAFLDPELGYYATGREREYRQTANLVPAAFGMVPKRAVAGVINSLVADVRARGDRLNTGCLGTQLLLPTLTTHGHGDLALRVARQSGYPGWAHWFEQGGDTMFECWEPTARSRDHYFLGTVVQWLYEHVAGLRAGEDGWKRFTVRPDARGDLSSASLMVDTVRGRAAASWREDRDEFVLEVAVPVGSTAIVHVPAAPGTRVRAVSAEGAGSVREVEPAGSEGGYLIFRAPSGNWRFTR